MKKGTDIARGMFVRVPDFFSVKIDAFGQKKGGMSCAFHVHCVCSLFTFSLAPPTLLKVAYEYTTHYP